MWFIILMLVAAAVPVQAQSGGAGGPMSPQPASVSPQDVFGHAEGAPHGATWTSWATTTSLAYPSSGPGYDDPGPAYGYPDHDTFGYTVESPDQGRWIEPSGNSLSGGANVIVEMGGFNRMGYTDLHADYWADVVFDARLRLWSDGDGHFEPNETYVQGGPPFWDDDENECHWLNEDAGYQPCIGPDDPCPEDGFPVMDVYAGTGSHPTGADTFLRTVYGGSVTNCSGPTASEAHSFTILPDPAYPGEPAGRFHIPKEILRSPDGPRPECIIRLWFVPHELELPHYASGHNANDDGISINITSVMVQLVAPPLVINHGYSADLNPDTEVLPNQWHLKLNIGEAMRQNFGQDPWAWANHALMPEGGIYLNSYDRKQDFRVSAQELSDKVDTQFTRHWTGKLWMQGQSMGGLVTRYYVEQLSGADHVEKLVQTATPNTGSFEPLILNYLLKWFYGQAENSPNHRLAKFMPPCFPVIPYYFVGWNDWWTAPPGNVFTYHCGFAHGRSRMADFELRPAGAKNPILHDMNVAYLQQPAGTLPPYFAVRAGLDVSPGFDGAVAFPSASLNGAIGQRTIKAFHEDTPSQPQTAVYFARFFGNLHLDTAHPKWCMPHVTRTPHAFVEPTNPGDVIDPNAGPDHVGNVTENMTFELWETTGGESLPFDNKTDDVTPLDTGAGGPRLVENRDIRLLVDATGPVRIAVHTAFVYPELRLSLVAPDGGDARASYRETNEGWTRSQEFTVERPTAGEYRLTIAPTGYATPFVLIGSWPSEHRLVLGTDRESHAQGEPVTLRAWVSGGPETTERVTAHVPTENGVVDVPLEGANGMYAAVWDGWRESGMYVVSVSLDGLSSTGRPFARNLTLTVLVEEGPTKLPADAGSPAGAPPTSSTPRSPASVSPDAITSDPPVSKESPTPGPGMFGLLAGLAAMAMLLRRRE